MMAAVEMSRRKEECLPVGTRAFLGWTSWQQAALSEQVLIYHRLVVILRASIVFMELRYIQSRFNSGPVCVKVL